MATPLCISCEKKSVKAGHVLCHLCAKAESESLLQAIDAQNESNANYGFRFAFGSDNQERVLAELR